jgi:hypothetical protein
LIELGFSVGRKSCIYTVLQLAEQLKTIAT